MKLNIRWRGAVECMVLLAFAGCAICAGRRGTNAGPWVEGAGRKEMAAGNAGEAAGRRGEAAGPLEMAAGGAGAMAAGPGAGVVVYVDSNSFSDKERFAAVWGYSYPWGPDHNGTARMYDSQVKVDAGILTIEAGRLGSAEGRSKLSPYLPIHYHSGAVHLKQMIAVSDSLPGWIISGDFQAPAAAGTWPAFWITGVDNWPPESDIMEFKGDDTVWQNTITGPDYRNVHWATSKTAVKAAAGSWHHYQAMLDRIDATNLRITYYVDGRRIAMNTANFMNRRFWLIINLQMEGSAGAPGPSGTTVMRARNIYVAARHV